jgi:hypothetical protein
MLIELMPKTTPVQSKESLPPAIPQIPLPVAIPPDDGKDNAPSYLENYLDVKDETLKYPSIQTQGILSISLDKELANQYVYYLEKTGWSQSDLGRLMVRTWMYLDKSQLFALLANCQTKGLYNSDRLEDLKYIRDELKKIGPGFVRLTGDSVSKFRKR